MIVFDVNPFLHQQALQFGVLNYEKQHKEGTCKVSGRSVAFSAFYADFCLCPKLVIITTLTTVFQSISRRLPVRGRKKREMIDDRKMSKQPPPAATASTVCPCLTIIQIGRMPRHCKFTQHHRTTQPPPHKLKKYQEIQF